MRSALTGGAPVGVFARAVDSLPAFMLAGQAWVAAGRPRDDVLYPAFVAAEREYNTCRDEVDKWAWTPEQHAEWARVHRAFDPLLPGQS